MMGCSRPVFSSEVTRGGIQIQMKKSQKQMKKNLSTERH